MLLQPPLVWVIWWSVWIAAVKAEWVSNSDWRTTQIDSDHGEGFSRGEVREVSPPSSFYSTHYAFHSHWSLAAAAMDFYPLLLMLLFLIFVRLIDSKMFPFFILSSSSLPQLPPHHTLPLPELLTDQQLCLQLPAPLATQPDDQLGERSLPTMVRMRTTCRWCCMRLLEFWGPSLPSHCLTV